MQHRNNTYSNFEINKIKDRDSRAITDQHEGRKEVGMERGAPDATRASLRWRAASCLSRGAEKGERLARQAAMVRAGDRQPIVAPSSSSFPILASTGSCAR